MEKDLFDDRRSRRLSFWNIYTYIHRKLFVAELQVWRFRKDFIFRWRKTLCVCISLMCVFVRREIYFFNRFSGSRASLMHPTSARIEMCVASNNLIPKAHTPFDKSLAI